MQVALSALELQPQCLLSCSVSLYALSWKLVRCRLPLGKEMLQVALLLAQITLVWPRLSAPLIGDGTVTTLPTVTPEVS